MLHLVPAGLLKGLHHKVLSGYMSAAYGFWGVAVKSDTLGPAACYRPAYAPPFSAGLLKGLHDNFISQSIPLLALLLGSAAQAVKVRARGML